MAVTKPPGETQLEKRTKPDTHKTAVLTKLKNAGITRESPRVLPKEKLTL